MSKTRRTFREQEDFQSAPRKAWTPRQLAKASANKTRNHERRRSVDTEEQFFYARGNS